MKYEDIIAFLTERKYIQFDNDGKIITKKINELMDFIKDEDNRVIIKNYSLIKEKKEFLLKFLNYILKNIGESEIELINDMPEISKLDLSDEKNMKYIYDNKYDLFELYNKNYINWYRRKSFDNYAITILKILFTDINVDFRSYNKMKNDGTSKIIFKIFKSV